MLYFVYFIIHIIITKVKNFFGNAFLILRIPFGSRYITKAARELLLMNSKAVLKKL